MRNKRTTQKELLAAHLLSFDREKGSYRTISHVEAFALYRVMSLSRRINDLEREGWKVKRTNKRDVTGARYTRYAFDLGN